MAIRTSSFLRSPRIHACVTSIALVLAALGPRPAAAQIHVLDERFQVNTYTTGTQQSASVAAADEGEFVVVWRGSSVPGDTSYGSIGGRAFDANGSGEEEFLVNLATADDQLNPAVATQPDGGFLVVWRQFGGRLPGSPADEIHARFLDAAGQPTGAEFLYSTYSGGDQEEPRVAFAADGGFLVAWRSAGSPGSDTSGSSVQARKFDAMGVPDDAQFQVNTTTGQTDVDVDVAAGEDGSFLVVWAAATPGEAGIEIRGRRVSAAGVASGDEIAVNTYTSSLQRHPTVAGLADGGFVVSWWSYGSAGTDSAYSYNASVQARRFSATAFPIGADFQVNTYTTGDQKYPQVAASPDGGFVVVWTGEVGVPSNDVQGMAGRAFDADGSAAGSEFGVEVDLFSSPQRPRLGADGEGRYVVAWHDAPGPADTDSSGILAVRFCLDLDTDQQCDGEAISQCGEAGDFAGTAVAKTSIENSPHRPAVITATDALAILAAAVGSFSCPLCVCDVNGSGATTATDALHLLRVAVGQPLPLNCPPCS